MATQPEPSLGVRVLLANKHKGIVRFMGETHFSDGFWYGIELDEAVGKNNGTVQGEFYFECGPNMGMFVKRAHIDAVLGSSSPVPPPSKPTPTPTGAGFKKPSRPSSTFGAATTSTAAAGLRKAAPKVDTAAGKRLSMNAASPSPVPRLSRPSSIARSPTKSPAKGPSPFPPPSASGGSSRNPTPSGGRGGITARGRTSVGGTARSSMGPPPKPGARQISTSATAGRVASGPQRTMSGRLSMSSRGGLSRPESASRTASVSSQGVRAAAIASAAARDADDRAISPKTSQPEILSPQPTTPHKARAAALEKLTMTGTSAASRSTSTGVGSRTGVSATTQREIETLKAKIKVLETKIHESRGKESELDHIRSERDKFESIIQKLQGKMKPQAMEMAEIKKQNQEARSRFEAIEQEVVDIHEQLELAVVDREMAEEEAQIAKEELEARKDRIEELELEVEVLREENEELSAGASPEEKSAAGFIQLQKYNERLKEALLRLRDQTLEREEDLNKHIKTLQLEVEENAEIKQQYEATAEKLNQAESAVEDMKQQLDAAGDVEEIIEDLGAQNADKEKMIDGLKGQIADLEDLQDINDELEINHVQNEKELQEEIDARDNFISDIKRREQRQDELIEDYEYTISKFRELVNTLQSDLEDMRASNAVTETESEQLNTRSRAMMDLNMKLQISAQKAQVKTIDLELRRLEAEEATKHLEILKMFLPDSYKDDKNSVLSFLRFKRLAFKANLLHNFIRERVTGQEHPGHEEDVFYGCDALDKLTWVAAMSDRFVHAIGHSTLEEFIRYDAVLYDLEPIERSLNGWIDNLRRGDLREKQCAEELSRTIAVLADLAEKHMSNNISAFADDIHMKTLVMQSNLESAATVFAIIKAMVARVVPPPSEGEDDEVGGYFTRRIENVVSKTRSVKVIAGKAVHDLEELKLRNLTLLPETFDAFDQCEALTQDLAQLARQTGMDLYMLLHEEGRTEPYTYAEVQSTVHKTAFALCSTTESDLFATYLAKMRTIQGQLADLGALCSDLGHTSEFERSAEPWFLRARELEASKTTPPDIEEEMRKLKEKNAEAHRLLAIRDEDLSTSKLKIETIESRMRDANTKVNQMTKLEGEIEEKVAEAMQLKEELEKADRELKSLELDRDAWRQKARDGRAVGGTGEEEEGGAAVGTAMGGGVRGEAAVATQREMDGLKGEVEALQAAVRHLRDSNRRARGVDQASYDWLAEPLVIPADSTTTQRRREHVRAEGRDCLSELVGMVAAGQIFDLKGMGSDLLAWRPRRESPAYHASRLREGLEAWKGWAEEVKRKGDLVRGGATAGDLRKETARSMRRNAARLRVRLPDGEGGVAKGVAGDGDGVMVVRGKEWEGMVGRVV